ncbi:hypothetical protein LJR164_000145 [Phenylobacterium sp. LjRoot164]|uniref:AcvB/VirJ family lysyl-phosphatidylglycerol hydrolase n=1 Tax=unclassified Phenylobacterium TaxID=2640670 RepID=UPI003ECD9A2D
MSWSSAFVAGAAVVALTVGSAAAVGARPGPAPGLSQALQAASGGGAPKLAETAYSFGAAGPVTIYKTGREPDRFVVFISGDGGWNLGVVDMARQLAGMDATVVGVDIRHYLRTAQAAKGAAIYPAGDFSSLSQAVQKSLGFARYHRPVVVGYSSGATLAYGTAAQAPSGIFQGAIGLGFCPDLKTVKPLAAGDGGLTHTIDAKLGFIYGPSRKLTTPFVAMQGGQDLTCLPAATHAFIAQTANARVIDLPKVGHGYSVPANWAPQFAQAFASFYPPAARPQAAAGARLAALPLVELPAAGRGDTMAVFYSGDGGWAGIDKGLASGFGTVGVPVVGYDSLRYFWTRRTPAEAASDLAAVLEHYMTAWGKTKVVLAGYSFGADALPAIVAQLPADLRAHVRLVALLGLDSDGELEFHPTDWLNQNGPTAYPIAPTLARLKGLPIVCLYGDQEQDAACPSFPAGLIRPIKLGGGHHFDGDYSSVGAAINRAAGL